MTVVPFPKHHWSHCGCQEGGCMECGGGIHFCTRCGGFEGTLTEDCPGVPMTEAQGDAVYEGELDFRFRHGGWTTWTRQREMQARAMTLPQD